MEIPNLTVYTCIGRACGGFGNVYLGKRTNGKAVAIRICPLEYEEINLPLLAIEITTLRSLRHPNIISLEEIIINGDYLCMLWPLMDFGSITDLIHARFMFGIPESAMILILYDVLKAVEYVHSRDFIHRGIRCSHILISSDGRSILSGFRNAISVIQEGKRMHTVHDFGPDFKPNLLWLAPEVLQQNLAGYSSRSDIYSIGISTCEMANGFPPFSDMAHMQMLFEKLRGTTPRLLDASTLIVEDMPKSDTAVDGVSSEQTARRFSAHLHNFTELCLRTNPAERPSATELLNHPLFKHAKRGRTSFRDIFQVKPMSPPNSARESVERRLSLPPTGVEPTTPSSSLQCNDIEWRFD